MTNQIINFSQQNVKINKDKQKRLKNLSTQYHAIQIAAKKLQKVFIQVCK